MNWVRIKDKSPEPWDAVLVFIPNLGQKEAIAKYDAQGALYFEDMECELRDLEGVTHWMLKIIVQDPKE